MSGEENFEDQRGSLVASGFTCVSTEKFLGHPETVPDTLGVYGLLIKGDLALAELGFVDQGRDPWVAGGHTLVYVGETIGLRSRLLHHLTGTIRESGFRHAILSLHFLTGNVLPVKRDSPLPNLEDALCRWVFEATAIAFRRCPLVREVEGKLIGDAHPPFNTKDRAPKSLATKRLRALRADFTNHLRASGQLHAAIARAPSSWFGTATIQRIGFASELTSPLSR